MHEKTVRCALQERAILFDPFVHRQISHLLWWFELGLEHVDVLVRLRFIQLVRSLTGLAQMFLAVQRLARQSLVVSLKPRRSRQLTLTALHASIIVGVVRQDCVHFERRLRLRSELPALLLLQLLELGPLVLGELETMNLGSGEVFAARVSLQSRLDVVTFPHRPADLVFVELVVGGVSVCGHDRWRMTARILVL